MTRSTHAPRDARAALTLLEVVVAIGVLSIVLLGVFSAMSSAQRSDTLTRERAAASEEAFKMLDSLLAGEVPDLAGPNVAVPFDVPFNSSRLVPADPYPTDPWTWVGETPPSSVTMAGIAVARVGVDMLDDDGTDPENDDLMEVRVTVAWRSAAWQVGQADQRIDIVGRRLR
jgi:type II secretory pathway pseudopilin PulG